MSDGYYLLTDTSLGTVVPNEVFSSAQKAREEMRALNGMYQTGRYSIVYIGNPSMLRLDGNRATLTQTQ